MNGSYEGICVKFKQNNIGFPTFKLPPCTTNLFLNNPLNIMAKVHLYEHLYLFD